MVVVNGDNGHVGRVCRLGHCRLVVVFSLMVNMVMVSLLSFLWWSLVLMEVLEAVLEMEEMVDKKVMMNRTF